MRTLDPTTENGESVQVSSLLYGLSNFWWVINSFVEERFLKEDPGYAAYMKRVP